MRPRMLLDNDERVLIQEEPPLEGLAIPQVFMQPRRPTFTRNRLQIGPTVDRALEAHGFGNSSLLGMAYGELLVEFQPGLDWAIRCWEYLLSTQGCRFLPREIGEKRYHRSDYRPMLERDFPILVRKTFKECLLSYNREAHGPDFAGHIRQVLWPTILERYKQLEQPLDTKQRKLTAFSYLRCIPYQFLNDYHHDLVHSALRRLSANQRQVAERYFLHFQTDEAITAGLQISTDQLNERRDGALDQLKQEAALAYHLLLQIERY